MVSGPPKLIFTIGPVLILSHASYSQLMLFHKQLQMFHGILVACMLHFQ